MKIKNDKNTNYYYYFLIFVKYAILLVPDIYN